MLDLLWGKRSLRRGPSCVGESLAFEQPSLQPQRPCGSACRGAHETTDPRCSHDPMAGDQRGETVPGHGLRCGAHRPWPAGQGRELRIGDRATRRHGSKRPPACTMEFGTERDDPGPWAHGWIPQPALDAFDELIEPRRIDAAGTGSSRAPCRSSHGRWCGGAGLNPRRARAARITTGQQVSGAKSPSFHAPSIRATALRSGHDASHRRASRVRRRRSHGCSLARHAAGP